MPAMMDTSRKARKVFSLAQVISSMSTTIQSNTIVMVILALGKSSEKYQLMRRLKIRAVCHKRIRQPFGCLI
jgi:hypothetical protein